MSFAQVERLLSLPGKRCRRYTALLVGCSSVLMGLGAGLAV